MTFYIEKRHLQKILIHPRIPLFVAEIKKKFL